MLRRAVCQECGTGFEADRGYALFCSTPCRKAFNNRRMVRGAELYDLFMCLRYERGLAKLKGVWTLVCALALQYRIEDERERAGRKSWNHPDVVLDRKPWLLAKAGKA